ncbi:MAG: FKBP-type peptidyl-prolyl cis-trans isomerase [Sphingomicrobium sp.]
MSVSTAAHPPRRGTARLWLGLSLLVLAGVALAWFGAGSLRPVVTKSGVEVRVVKAGSGPRITDEDAALLDYELRGDDGTVIDSSARHGGPQPFMSQGVFPGFAEGMRQMQDGGEYRLKFPQKLAFENGPPAGFPPTANLHFTVQVRKVVRGGAAMLRQQMMMQQMQQGQPQQ